MKHLLCARCVASINSFDPNKNPTNYSHFVDKEPEAQRG